MKKKLTDYQINSIRKLYFKEGRTIGEIRTILSIKYHNVRNILIGKTYKNVK